MAVGQAAGVVVRSRSSARPTNLVVQTQGFDPRTAATAAAEAGTLLEQAAFSNDIADVAPAVPGLPLACGSLDVNQGRHRVTYRVVGQVVVMVVTDISANGLACLDLLERSVRVVTFDLRSPEVTLERFSKRFHEVYMALSMLLTNASGTISAAKALLDGKQALDSLAQGGGKKAVAAAVAAAAAAAVTGDVGNPGGGSGGGAPLDPGGGPAAALLSARKRTLAGQSAQLPIQLGFPTYDAMAPLKPLPGFENTDQSGAKQVSALAKHQLAVMPSARSDDIFGSLPDQAGKGKDGGLAGMLDDLSNMLGPPVAGKDKKDKEAKKGEDPFSFIEDEMAPAAKEQQEQQAQQAALPPPPPVPPVPLLRLTETWRAEVRGSTLVRASLHGEVTCSHELHQVRLPAVGFALALQPPQSPQQPPAGQQQGGALSAACVAEGAVRAAVGAARVLASVVRPGWPAGYQVAPGYSDTGGEADLEAFSVDVALARGLLSPVVMRYGVPLQGQLGPGWRPPLQVTLSASVLPMPGGDSQGTAVLLGVQLQLDPRVHPSAVAGLDLKVHVPTLFELPARVRPAGAAMDGSRRVLRWQLHADPLPPPPPPPPPAPPAPPAPAASASQQPQQAGTAAAAAPAAPHLAPQPQQPLSPAGQTLAALCAGPVAFSAAFQVSGSVAAAKGVLRTVLAELEVRGRPGTTLTGVLLRQHGFVGAAGQQAAADAACSWKATAVARLLH